MSENQEPERQRGQSLGTVIRSVFSSMFGVQSSDKHEEDFARGKVSSYVIVGLLATIIFVLAIWGLVKLVVSVAVPQG